MTSDAIRAMEYVIDNGIKLSNNSWGGGPFSQALYDAIAVSQGIGHLFVAAAGNCSFDNDLYPHYPSGYELPNIIAVAATDNDDNLASFSNWGATTVDLAAPGVDIYSTVPESGYAYGNGTSMATPHVTGVVALVMGRLPTASWQEVRDLVVMTVRPVDSLSGLTVTGGVVNAEAAAGDCNGNGVPDGDDITGGTSADCTGNGIPDECEPDCNGNGVADSCDVSEGTSEDCNNNGVPDDCEPGGTQDCNGNGIADLCDIYMDFSEDCNYNFVPDECELAAGTEDDCNGNNVLDVCDLTGGTSLDCNENGVPDECDLVSGNWPDADQNGIPDSCEVTRLFVNPEATGLNNGLTWANALTDLAAPLVMAANPEIPLTEIWVAAGTYKPDRGTGNRMETFRLVDGVALYGGFAGGESSLAERNPSVNVTILSGDLNGDDGPDFANSGENSYHVVDGSEIGATTVLDGFTVTGGNADSLSDLGEGAGLYIFDGSPTVRDCVFTGNSAVGPYGWGGGVSSWATCSSTYGKPTFTRCIFSGNRASYTGGGMSSFFTEPTLFDCTFIGNSSIFVGGGLYDEGLGATLSNCAFIGNTAGYGGGVYADGLFQWFAQLELTNCILTGNSADLDGGALYLNDGLATLANCTLVGNSAPHGPALALDSEDQASPSNIVVTNSVLWNGGNDIWNNDNSMITLTYSNLPAGWPGAGNIAADPLFLDADGPDDIPGTEDDNLRLMPGSPGIDAGNNDAVPGQTTGDFDGAPRFVDDPDTVDTGSGTPPIVDMGAYEFADCNDNDVTDWADIADGTSNDCTGNGVPDECEPDCNGNGVADSCDIAEGTSADCNGNGIPDDCEPDCNGNGVADSCDIAGGTSEDCNRNEAPDECDIAAGTSEDDNENGVPDECERDCNDNGVWDSEDIAAGTSQDCNDNLVPDECDIADGTSQDYDQNGVPDECEPTIYVDKENCTWPGTGTITDPFCKIQHGIDASVSGYTILVADGTYTSTDNTELDFGGRAITVRSKNGPDNCIIHGSNIYHAFVFTNGESADSRVEGFTIRNTLAGIYSGSIMCIDSSPTIHGCVFWNTPKYSIFLLDGGNSTISSCSIINAAGIRCHASHPVIRDCLFLEARSDAVECHEASAPLILNSTFLAGTGDGIALIHGSSPTIVNCTLAYNDDCGIFVNPVGPGPWHTRILNCTIVNNGIGTGAHGSRYGIYIGQGEVVTIGNCIVRNNVPDNFYLWGTPEVTVTYSNIEGGWPDVGNIDSDPLFIDPEDYDFRLSNGSPSIDAGDNDNVAADVLDLDGDGDTIEPLPSDLDGAPRFWDHPGAPDMGSGTPPLVDMGAHEYRDCNDNGMNDSSEIVEGTSQDCNENSIPDDCDIAGGTSGDCDGAGNGIPDECEPDCNANGAADSCDLVQGTSLDCDGNEVPDECQPDCDDDAIPDVCELPPFGSSADCNTNTVPDECDIDQGTSQDCNGNTVPDECDLEAGPSADCNENAVPDECDIAGETSADFNGNGVPDECEFNAPIEAAPPDNVPKNRYVSFGPNNAEVRIAFQVEMTASTYFPDSLGVVGWVGEPDETGIARVVDQPFFAETWPVVVHLGDCRVVPAAAYALRATMDGITLGEALGLETIAPPTPKYWADVVGEFSGTVWTGPNGEVNMDDVTAAVQKFQQLPPAPPLTWVDLDAEAPNGVLNFTDIMRIVQGFKGEPYPFSDPAVCP